MDIGKLYEEEKQFFTQYKKVFKSRFLNYLHKAQIDNSLLEEVERWLPFLYEAFFHLNEEKFLNRLREVLYRLHRLNIPLRKALVYTLAGLIKDFIDYSERENRLSLTKIKLLTDTAHRFLKVSDEAFTKFIEETTQKRETEEIVDRASQEEVLKTLRRINPVTLTLLGLYKEFPVYCKTDVYKIGDTLLKVSACPYKIFTPGTKVYLKTPRLKKGILARVVNVDGEYYIISPLKFTEFPEIKSVRIFPEKEIDVEIEVDGEKLYGFLTYLSVGELAVILKDLDGLEKGKKVKVSFHLPSGEVKTTAKVREITPLKGSYKVEFFLDLDLRLDQIISKYVLERQRQILKELKL